MKRPSKPQDEWLTAYRYEQKVLLQVAISGAEQTPDAARLRLTYTDADFGLLLRSGLAVAATGDEETSGRLDRRRRAHYGH
jgi:hypothetical protein